MLQQNQRKWLAFLFFFLALYIISVLFNLNNLLLSGEEPRRAIVSIEMLHSGKFVVPTIFGWNYYNKPPLFNWVMAFFIFISGSASEVIIRLPSLFSMLVWAGVHYVISKKFLPKSIAALSAVFLLTGIDVYFYGLQNGGEIDLFYSFLVYLQVISIFYFGYNRQWLLLYGLSYLLCALGFLTKGFPSLLFQFFTLFALCTFFRSIKLLFKWQHLIGFLVFLIVIGGFLYSYSLYGSPKLLLINLLNEAFKKSAVGNDHAKEMLGNIFTFPFLLFKFLLPWSLLFLLLFKKIKLNLWRNPLIKFSLLFIVFNIGIYWFTGKPKLRYINMFLPFFDTILAYIFWKYQEVYPLILKRPLKYAGGVFILLLCLLVAFPFFIKTNVVAVLLLFVLLLGFTWFYYKKPGNIWWLATGIVLARLAYAVLVVPVQQQNVRIRYDQLISKMVKANDSQTVVYWSPPYKKNFEIDVRSKKWQFDSVSAPPETYYHIPYYYFRKTGKIMKYDTILKENQGYIANQVFVNEEEVKILWSWFDDRENQGYVLFRKKATSGVPIAQE